MLVPMYHFFADDSKLHKSSVPSNFAVLVCCLKYCIEDVAEWMGDSKLKMNDDKTELMAIGTRSKLSQVIPSSSSAFDVMTMLNPQAGGCMEVHCPL